MILCANIIDDTFLYKTDASYLHDSNLPVHRPESLIIKSTFPLPLCCEEMGCKYLHCPLYRVPTQVLQSLIKSYICFFVCKALQSLFLSFLSKRSYKILFLLEKKGAELRNVLSKIT